MRVSAKLVNQRQSYTLNLADTMKVGRLARYLSQQEGYIESSTLEIARPLGISQRLQDVDIQAGDRLLIFAVKPAPAELSAPLSPGDKIMNFRVGDVVISSRGKKNLVLGKPDSEKDVDIDLRNFISPKQLSFISRDTMRVDFDDRSKSWYAARTGRTRITLNDFELGADRIPLGDETTLRFYRANEDPKNSAFRPISEIQMTTETVQSREDIIYLETGEKVVNIQVGVEKDSAALNISENVPFGQVASNLAAYLGAAVGAEYQLCLMRLIPPGTALGGIALGNDEFFYTARTQSFALNTLILSDIHSKDRSYQLVAGPEDDIKLIGRRSEAAIEDPELDLDLYEVVIAHTGNANAFKNISRRQLRVFYIAAENTWWAQAEERASVPVFVNNTRATSNTPIQLTSGDVISVGSTVENYVARLEVEITAKAD
jgi:hypothetical protein